MSSAPPLAGPPAPHWAGGATSSPSAFDPRERYSRQVLFRGIGAEGQAALQRAHTVVVGVGATGAAVAGLLARAGVGRLSVIDRDFVEPSNLQRQVLFDEDDARASLPKAEAARRHLVRINSDVTVQASVADLIPANAANLLAGSDLVVDCTDNFETRYLINDLCVRDGRPWIYTAAVGAYAVSMNILPRTAPADDPPWWQAHAVPTACLACLFSAAPQGELATCETEGVLGPAVNLAASFAVAEALKLLSGQPQLLRRSLLSHDLWTGERSEIAAGRPRADCLVCGDRQFQALQGAGRPQITLCGRNSVQIHEHHRPVDLLALERRLAPLGVVRANGLLLRFSYPPYTLTVFPDGRALIQGTTDAGLARSLYARFLGS